MTGILQSRLLKLTDEDFIRVQKYCQERGMRYSHHVVDRKDTRNIVYIWGTRKELKESELYF